MSQNPIDEAVGALLGVVSEYWNTWAEETPRNRRLRTIAVELCKKKRRNPDVVVMGVAGQVPAIGGNDLPLVCHPVQTAWASYLPEAEMALAAVEQADKERETERKAS